MENNDFTLDSSQNNPLQNLKNLKWLLLEINITCPHLTIAKHIHNAREKIALLIATLDFDLCGELIADIEKAKWEAAEKYSSAIFQIVKAEWLAWEIFADCPIPFAPADMNDAELSPYGSISWKTDYQSQPDNQDDEDVLENLVNEAIESGDYAVNKQPENECCDKCGGFSGCACDDEPVDPCANCTKPGWFVGKDNVRRFLMPPMRGVDKICPRCGGYAPKDESENGGAK